MIFISKNPIAAPPWHIKNQEQGVVVDSWGRLVCLVTVKNPRLSCDNSTPHNYITTDKQFPVSNTRIIPQMDVVTEENTHLANLYLIAAAPELLSALKEAAYQLDRAGIPLNEKYYELINKAQQGMPALKPFSVDKQKEN